MIKQQHHNIKHGMILFFFILPSLYSHAQDAREIIKKMDEKNRGTYSEQELRMTIVRPDWTRTIAMKSWSKGTAYSLILITEPAKEKGQVFLKREKEMWNWVPSIERMIKIPPSMMMQSWMGSDFTNDDLVRESSIIEDYTHTLLGTDLMEGTECWKIQLDPDPDAPVVWGKILAWVGKDYNQRKVEYYDEDGYLVNTMMLYDIKRMHDRDIPCRMEMIPEGEENKKTTVEVISARYNEPIAESFFSIQNMKLVR